MARTKSAEKQKRRDHLENMQKTDNEFEIETILDKRGAGRTLQYYVKWKGYPDSDNTWESHKDLPASLVKKYEDSLDLSNEDSDEEEDAAAKDDDEEEFTLTKSKSSPKKSSPKKNKRSVRVKKPEPKKAVKQSPKPVKKAAVRKPVALVVKSRSIINNVVHYYCNGRAKPIPLYDFEDFQPIFDFEIEQAQSDSAIMEPIRVVEKKGNKYFIEWKKGSRTWEDRTNLACAKLMMDFDDREEDFIQEDDIEYSVKKIIEKRKFGRGYEYKVIWSGSDEETATWEPPENLKNAQDKVRDFEKVEARELADRKAKKAEKRKSKSNSEAKPEKVGKKQK